MKIEVWLDETNTKIEHEAKSTYTKGPMYCVMLKDGTVYKYPVTRIFRVKEHTESEGGAG